MSDPLKSGVPELWNGDVPEDRAIAIADIVEAQKSVVEGWVRYATGSLDRLQTGDFDAGAWSRDLSRVIRETSSGTVRVLGAFARLRTER